MKYVSFMLHNHSYDIKYGQKYEIFKKVIVLLGESLKLLIKICP